MMVKYQASEVQTNSREEYITIASASFCYHLAFAAVTALTFILPAPRWN